MNRRIFHGLWVLVLACVIYFCGLPAVLVQSAEEPGTDQFYSGNALYNRKLYLLAVAEYRSFLEKYPNHSKAEEARLGIALGYYAAEKYKEAEPYLKAVIDNGKAGDRNQLNLLRGQCLLKLNNPQEAEKVFEAGVNSGSKYQVPALAGMAEAQFKQGKWAEVVLSGDQLLKANPGLEYRKRGLYQGGYARHQLKKFAEAVPLLEELSKLMKDDPLDSQAAFLLAECYRESGKLVEAAAEYAVAVKGLEGPMAAEVNYRLGCVNFMQEKYDDAIAAFDQCLKKEAQGKFAGQATLFLGRSWLEKRDFGRAVNYLRQLSTQQPAQGQGPLPNVEAYLWLARAYSRQKNYGEASRILNEGLSKFNNSPSTPDMLFDYGNALIAQDKFQDAHTAFEQIYRWQQWPQISDAMRLDAVCLHRTNDYNNSLRCANDFLAKFPKDEFANDMSFLKAENLFLLDRADEAMKAYAEFLAVNPKHGSVDAATFRIARIHHKKGEWAEALKVLMPLADKKPEGKEFSQINFVLGDCNFRLEKWDAAITNLDAFVKVYQNKADEPNLDSAYAQLAVASLNKRDTKSTMEYFRTLIGRYQQSPHMPLALAELGRLQYEAKEYGQARLTLDHFVRSFEKDPRRAQAEYYFGWISLAEKKEAEAEQHFSVVTRSYPNDPLAVDSFLQLGLVQLSQEKFKDAQGSLSHLTRTYPNHPRIDLATYSLGVAYAREKNWGPAAENFKKVTEQFLKSEHADHAAYEWAWCEKGMNRKDEAVKCYEYLIATYPKSDLINKAKIELAELMFDAKKYDEVIAQLKQMLVEISDRKLKEQTVYRLGTAYFNKGDFEESAKVFEAFLKDFPESSLKASASFQAGEARLKLKETVVARDHFLTASQAASKQPEIHESALMRLGETQGLTKQWMESARTYEAFLHTYPQSKWINAARFGFAWALEKQNDFNRALVEYRKIVAAQSKDELSARSQFQIGECLFAMQKYDEAVQELIRVDVNYRYDDWKAKALLEMARALEAKGEKNRAQEQYKEVIKRFPQHDAATVAKKRIDALRHET